MVEAAPIARSPIAPVPPTSVEHGWEVSARRSAAELKITDCTPLAKVLVLASTDGELASTLGRERSEMSGLAQTLDAQAMRTKRSS